MYLKGSADSYDKQPFTFAMTRALFLVSDVIKVGLVLSDMMVALLGGPKDEIMTNRNIIMLQHLDSKL